MSNGKQTYRARPSGNVVLVVTGLVGLLAVLLASPVMMPRLIRRHPDWLKFSDFKRYAAFRRRQAGHRHSVVALLTHVGRRTGKAYRTPLGAQPYGDGFVVSLPYGSQTDWCSNVMAAGMCKLAWKGNTYALERPEIVSGSQVFPALPVHQRILLQGGGIRDFLWLHRKEINTGNGADIGR